MAMVYIITERHIRELRKAVELTKLTERLDLDPRDRALLDRFHKKYAYELESWIAEVKAASP